MEANDIVMMYVKLFFSLHSISTSIVGTWGGGGGGGDSVLNLSQTTLGLSNLQLWMGCTLGCGHEINVHK